MEPHDPSNPLDHLADAVEHALQPVTRPVRRGWRLFWRWVRHLSVATLVLILLFCALVVALRLPVVQTWAVAKLTALAREKTGFDIRIGRVDLNWYDELLVSDVQANDLEGHPMIVIPEASIDFALHRLLRRDIGLDALVASGGSLHLITSRRTGEVNMTQFVEHLQAWLSPGTERSANPPNFRIGKAALSRFTITIDDERYPVRVQGVGPAFDERHMHFEGLSLFAEDFRTRVDTMELRLLDLSAREHRSGLPIHRLRGFFRNSRNTMTMYPMQAWVGRSYLGDSLSFGFAKPADMGYFIDTVMIHARLKRARVDYRDLALFNEGISGLRDSLRISGRMRGRVKDFVVDRLEGQLGRGSSIKGRVAMRGLPYWRTTQMEIQLKPGSYLLPQDLRQYVPATAYTYLERLGPTDLEGRFKGRVDSFATHGHLYTRLGTLAPDINMAITTAEQTRYKGSFVAERFDVGKLLALPGTLQTVTGQGSVQGRGLTLASAQTDLKARFEQFGLRGYNYHNIVVDARLARSRAEGMLDVRDSNLRMEAQGVADLSGRVKKFDLTTELDLAALGRLGLSPVPFDVAGTAVLRGTGSNLDDAEGQLRLGNVHLAYQGRPLAIDTLSLQTHRDGRDRYIDLRSNLVSARVRGDFEFRTLAADAEASLNDYGRLFKNAVALRNKTARYSAGEYALEMRVDAHHLSPLLQVFYPELQLADGATLEADIQKTTNLMAQIGARADYVAFGGSVIDGPRLDVVSSKTLDGPDVLASVSLLSPSQRLGNLYTKDMVLDGTWNADGISFRTAIAQDQTVRGDSGFMDVGGRLVFLPSKLEAALTQARVRVVDSIWTVAEGNRLVYDGRRVQVDSLTFRTEGHGQQLSVDGMAGRSEQDSLYVGIDSLQLAFLDQIIGGPWRGKADGRVILTGLLGKPGVLGRVMVPGLSYQGVVLGDVSASLMPQAADASLAVAATIRREGKALLAGGGSIKAGLDPALKMSFDLTGAPIKILEPLFAGLSSNWKGQAFGQLALGGTLSAPVLTGQALIQDGAMTVDYLRTRYTFSDTIRLAENYISATGLTLYDQAGHPARLTRGLVRHRHFEDFSLDINADLASFQVLGTGYRDSKLYYGSAYVSGPMGIHGPVGDIVITADVKTEKGTRLFLPLSDAQGQNMASTEQFIVFKDATPEAHPASAPVLVPSRRPDAAPADTAGTLAKTDSVADERVNLTGIRLNFNLDVTPDAQGEIIFDRKTGDAVRATGQGRIKMFVDTRGDFSMFGRYQINQGQYRFTLANVINKDFDILSGSTVTWNGDPAGALLDIQARYTVPASLTPLLIGVPFSSQADSVQKFSEASRRYPVSVNMNLAGPMTQPAITLGIDVPANYPSGLSQYVTTFNNAVATSDQELNKQVFSLLILRSFSPLGVNTYGNAGLTASNLGEMLSNQLSSWLSGVNQNLEVGVNLNGFNQQAIDNVQLRLSYTALDGRLRVTRNGAFTNTASQTTASSVAGDWTLEYNLTRDGKVRAKVFHRTNQTLTGAGVGSGQYYTTTQGASVLHTQSFSSLPELLPWLFKTRKEREAIPTKPPETAPSTPADPISNAKVGLK